MDAEGESLQSRAWGIIDGERRWTRAKGGSSQILRGKEWSTRQTCQFPCYSSVISRMTTPSWKHKWNRKSRFWACSKVEMAGFSNSLNVRDTGQKSVNCNNKLPVYGMRGITGLCAMMGKDAKVRTNAK